MAHTGLGGGRIHDTDAYSDHGKASIRNEGFGAGASFARQFLASMKHGVSFDTIVL